MSKMFKSMLAKMAVRNKEIYELRKSKTISDAKIGKQFGITRQRVKAIFTAQMLKEKEAE